MNIYTVSFFGHRTIENQDDVEIRLEGTIDNILNNNDYVRFLVGYEGEFDLLVAPIIHHCRKKSGKYNNELVLVMPYIRKEYLNYQKSFYQNYDFIEVCSQSSLAYYKQSIVIRSDILPPPTLRLEAGASRSSTATCTVSAS